MTESTLSSLSAVSRDTVILFGEVLADEFPDRYVLGGAPFNVARHLQAFGLHPVLITRVGNDALGEELLNSMADFAMDTIGIQCDPVYPTGRVMVQMNKDGHIFNIAPDQAYDHIQAEVARMVALSVSPKLVYFGTLAQRHPDSRHALNSLLLSIDAPCLLDINLRDPWYDTEIIKHSLLSADMVKMNQEELTNIARQLQLPGASLAEQMAALIKRFSLKKLIITCGVEGAWIMSAQGDGIHAACSTQAVHMVDTVGAGDGFAAVFILGTLRNWSAAYMLAQANRFAAALCEIRGAIPDDPEFYRPFQQDWKTQ